MTALRLVTNTSILMAALIKRADTRAILLSGATELLVPEYSFEEILRHRSKIAKLGKLDQPTVEALVRLVKTSVAIVPAEKITPYLAEARRIMAHIDRNDVPFVALALAVPNDGIWTEDAHFLKQQRVKIWRTADVLRFLRVSGFADDFLNSRD